MTSRVGCSFDDKNKIAKSHARDYLIGFIDGKDCESWLRCLVVEAINTNGNISDDVTDKIYANLKCETAINIPELSDPGSNTSQRIVLKTLKHIGGVNALAENQEIIFSDDVTILYGLNGAGKSGYFRVLNEIVGGNEKKEILPNIHTSQSADIDVKLTYYDSRAREIAFDNSQRGVNALVGCKVFDSSYLKGLLSERSQGETVLEPLGLHLFKCIATQMDFLRNKLLDDSKQLRSGKPNIVCEDFSDELKEQFLKHKLLEGCKEFLEENFEFSHDDELMLDKKKQELDVLRNNNPQDRTDYLSTENDEITRALGFLKNIDALNNLSRKISELLVVKNQKQAENKAALAQLSILDALPLKGDKAWKEFIERGECLKSVHPGLNEYCLYCNQPLSEDAIEIVRAYGMYLNDKTETDFKEAVDNLEGVKRELVKLSFGLYIGDKFKSVLKSVKLEAGEKSYNRFLSELEKEFDSCRDQLIEKTDGTSFSMPDFSQCSEILNWLENRKLTNQQSINKLKQSNVEREKNMGSLKRVVSALLEKRSISAQSDDIKKWIELTEREECLKKRADTITTSQITRLSNEAHKELLTENLKDVLKDEMKQLDFEHIEVELVKAKSDKGMVPTKLVLKEGVAIDRVLSEGELKAVGLALFIAEARIQKTSHPIILDDPINSLDHRVAGKFSDRLLALENQLIIFNHNRLFQDAFETAGNSHLCKTNTTDCSKKGRHVQVYAISSEGRSKKGVLIFKKKNTVEGHIEMAKAKLNQSPFFEHESVATHLRKAVECFIDEKILLGIVPRKYSNKKNNIMWEKLKKLKDANPDNINTLQDVHGRLSGAELHDGNQARENSIDAEELHRLVERLERVLEPK